MPYMHSDSGRHGCGGYRQGYRFKGVPQRTHEPGPCRPWRGVLGATSPLDEILPKRFTQSFCIPQAGHRLTARLSAIAVYRFKSQPSFELVSPTFARDGAFTAITIFFATW
jgi:hypothetical protein